MIEHNGFLFPSYDGQPLSWAIGSYMTDSEAEKGYPKAKIVARAMRDHRPGELEQERREMLKASFGIFGRNAKRELDLIEAVLEEQPQ
jgi:hypothetical protein